MSGRDCRTDRVRLDAIDPEHSDPRVRASIEASLASCAVSDRVNLVTGRSRQLMELFQRGWERARPCTALRTLAF